MRLYHVTDRAAADAILKQGFADAEVIHDDREVLIGVWLADRCLAGEDDVGPRTGPVADVALEIDLPARLVETYERRERGKPYREFCVPASVLNRHEVDAVRELEDVELNERRRQGDALEAP
jgi:hypothetical protein